ncbi:hypothetical protein AV530_003293 [Patagioenas fasciata monilis]|uniref:Uncharacterized protein n=1 Tax=Patagioenas fasciata monilis TaxID=372326 RepID=A0A1V4K252_PATFA|nr:hypothetical protein AV530_003293 [Patagioenas fasciata monilis]
MHPAEPQSRHPCRQERCYRPHLCFTNTPQKKVSEKIYSQRKSVSGKDVKSCYKSKAAHSESFCRGFNCPACAPRKPDSTGENSIHKWQRYAEQTKTKYNQKSVHHFRHVSLRNIPYHVCCICNCLPGHRTEATGQFGLTQPPFPDRRRIARPLHEKIQNHCHP